MTKKPDEREADQRPRIPAQARPTRRATARRPRGSSSISRASSSAIDS